MGRISDFASWFTTKSAWYVYSRLQANIRRNLTFETLWAEAAASSAKFIGENFDEAVIYHDRMDFWRFIVTKLPPTGSLIEVGVFRGQSVNFIADRLTAAKDARLVHGFDSFEGLEEDWSGEGLGKGYFHMEGKLPPVRPNVRLHKGWIQDTLAPFLAESGDAAIGLLHIDTDTYTPARCALELVKSRLREGSVIVFDELVGYPNWQAHEAKALTETLKREDYAFIGFTSRQAALRLLRAP